jgi:hypothetical protein
MLVSVEALVVAGREIRLEVNADKLIRWPCF